MNSIPAISMARFHRDEIVGYRLTAAGLEVARRRNADMCPVG